jgi:hypothetical protein
MCGPCWPVWPSDEEGQAFVPEVDEETTMKHVITDPDWDQTYFTVETVNDGRVMVTLGDPDYFVCLTADQWREVVEATCSVWEREHPSITRMREDVEAMRARGEHVPVEITHFLKTHPKK